MIADLASEPWFGWAVGLSVGLPVALILLSELHGALVRRGSGMAAPVAMARNFAVPATALLILFTQVWELDREETWVRILATVVGFLAMVLVLAALNVVLFQQAATGTWRERMPSIFVDIARLVLVVAGLAIVFAWVWGANVGGLFAALGVTSIVLGFALQNAVGSIISGLLLLFEQPFRLGDWLDTGSVRGRVVGVNWRAVHIDTGNGTLIVPNASLAGDSFTNLSQPAGTHAITIPTTFAVGDRPDAVAAMLDRVAGDIPVPGIEPNVDTVMTASKSYATTIAIRSPADADAVAATFVRWAWYASRRAGLHLDGATDEFATPELVLATLRSVGPALHVRDDEMEAVAARMHIERWAAGEVVQHDGEIPDALRIVVSGRVAVYMRSPLGDLRPSGDLAPGERLGITALVRQPSFTTARAVSELEVLVAPIDLVEDLARTHPALARDLGREIDNRRERLRTALGQGPRDTTPTSTTAADHGQN